MKRKLNAGVLTLVLLFVCAIAGVQTAFASCGVSCVAICRYTCEWAAEGNCTDQQINTMVQQCCAGAFANTPGINDVPCMQSGGS